MSQTLKARIRAEMTCCDFCDRPVQNTAILYVCDIHKKAVEKVEKMVKELGEVE